MEGTQNDKLQSRKDGQATDGRSTLEQDLTVRQATRAYPMAIFWCLAVSTCVIMEGYDSKSILRGHPSLLLVLYANIHLQPFYLGTFSPSQLFRRNVSYTA
jgi:hypothetical protein